VDDGLLPFLEHVLEDKWPPGAATCLHQRATLVELPQLDGCEPKLFGKICHGFECVLVVARQKEDAMAAVNIRVGCQGGCRQVIEAFHEFGAAERFCDEGGRRKAVQVFWRNAKRIRRVDDRLAFPVRQGLCNFRMLFE